MALETTFASVDQFVPAELVGGAIGAAGAAGAVATGMELVSGFHPAVIVGGGALIGAGATFAIRKLSADEAKYREEVRQRLLARAEAFKAEKPAEKPAEKAAS